LSSDVTEIVLNDYPAAPEAPIKVDSQSTIDSIFLKWENVPGYELNLVGYELWMDSGSDGFFKRVFDGRNKPGIMNFTVTDLVVGRGYKFKVRAVNFNGAGPFSTEVTLFSCLPPETISPP